MQFVMALRTKVDYIFHEAQVYFPTLQVSAKCTN